MERDLNIFKESNPLYNFLIMQQEIIEKLESDVYEMQKQTEKIPQLELVVDALQNSISSIYWRVSGLSNEELHFVADKLYTNNNDKTHCIQTIIYCDKTNVVYISFMDYKNELFVSTMLSVDRILKIVPTKFWPFGVEWKLLSSILDLPILEVKHEILKIQ